MTLAKSIYNLGRVYALLEKQDKLTAEQTLLFKELKIFHAKITEMDYRIYSVFELGRLMGQQGKRGKA